MDVTDLDGLRRALRRGRRVFLLNLPRDASGASDRTECESVRAILAALEGSSLEAVVAEVHLRRAARRSQ